MLYGDEYHSFCIATGCVAGKKIKGVGESILYTPGVIDSIH